MKEEWKPVVGYENQYEISNLGKVRSVTRAINNKHGRKSVVKGINKKTSFTRLGYENVSLCKGGIEKKFYIHRLVAQSFIPNPDGKETVNHMDGIKSNNCVSNLEWLTQKENVRHSFDSGKRDITSGTRCWNATLTDHEVLLMRKLSKINGGSYETVEIAKLFGVHRKTVYNIVNNKTRNNINIELNESQGILKES